MRLSGVLLDFDTHIQFFGEICFWTDLLSFTFQVLGDTPGLPTWRIYIITVAASKVGLR